MKIRPEYYVNFEEDDVCIMQRLADGTERYVSPISVTAAMVWDGIEHGLGREALIDAVATEFSADPDRVAADLDMLLEQLTALGYAE